MSKETQQPLYKGLNEKRHNSEEWISGGASGRMITTESGYVGDGFIADFDTKANSQYAILAVNHLAKVADALDSLIDWCIQFTPEYPAALVKAKEALAAIS